MNGKQKHEIFSLLRTLSGLERKEFGRFLRSPYFNTNEKIVSLYSLIIRYGPVYVEDNLTEEEIYKTVYGNGQFNVSTIRNLYFRLNELAKRFLTVKELEKNRLTEADMLLHQLNSRGIRQSFEKTLRRAEGYANTEENFSRDSCYYKYKLANHKRDFAKLTQHITNETICEHMDYLSDSDLYLTIFYVTEIICDYLLTQVQAYKFGTSLDTNFTSKVIGWVDIDKIVEYCEKNKRKEFLLSVYAALLKAYVCPEDYSNYFKYREIFFRYKKHLSQVEISFHYARLINYCNLKRDAMCTDFDKELFHVYKEAISDRHWKNDVQDYLPSSLFRAIVFLAVHLNETAWLKEFIAENTKWLHPKERENMHNFAMAYYHFATRNYAASLDYTNHLILKDFDNFIYKYDVHNLETRLFYELGYFESTLPKISAYMDFIKNDEFLEASRKTHHKNFIRFLKYLTLYRLKERGIEDIQFARTRLEKENEVLYKKWLIQEYDRVLKGISEYHPDGGG